MRQYSSGWEPTSLWTHMDIAVRSMWRAAGALVAPAVAPGEGQQDSEGSSCHVPVGTVGSTDNPLAFCA